MDCPTFEKRSSYSASSDPRGNIGYSPADHRRAAPGASDLSGDASAPGGPPSLVDAEAERLFEVFGAHAKTLADLTDRLAPVLDPAPAPGDCGDDGDCPRPASSPLVERLRRLVEVAELLDGEARNLLDRLQV